MGWSFMQGFARKEIIEHLTRETTDGKTTFRTIAQCCKGTVLYTVQENETNVEGVKTRFVCVYLLQNGGRYDGWGYKAVDETMGPFQKTCPPKYFEIAGPTFDKTAQRWRKACIEAAAERKVKGSVKVGDTIVFKAGITIGQRSEKERIGQEKAVVSKRKGRGIWVTIGAWDNVRIKVSHIDHVLKDGGGRRAAHAAQTAKDSE